MYRVPWFLGGCLAGLLLASMLNNMNPGYKYPVDYDYLEGRRSMPYGNFKQTSPILMGTQTYYTNQSIFYFDYDSLRVEGENEGVLRYFDDINSMKLWIEDFSLRLVYLNEIIYKQENAHNVYAQGTYWDDVNFPIVEWCGAIAIGPDTWINDVDTIGWAYPVLDFGSSLTNELKWYPNE